MICQDCEEMTATKTLRVNNLGEIIYLCDSCLHERVAGVE